MRRNFAEVLRNGKIDINEEYTNLFELFYETSDIYFENFYKIKTLREIVALCFKENRFRGTCLTLEQFDRKYGFEFEKYPNKFDVNYLVFFCEYMYNLTANLSYDLSKLNCGINKSFYLNHIQKVIEGIGYMQSEEDGVVIFVPKDSAAISVSESPLIPEDISYKVIAYNHHSRQGDLEAKKDIIRKLADLLEPKRADLKCMNKDLEKDLFMLFNNLNIRHNNIDPANPANYRECIAKMPNDELESWYDETYQMCLLAFMELEHSDRKVKLDQLKKQF